MSSELEFEIITGLRVGTSLMYIKSEQQLYKVNSKLKESTIYLCVNRNCKARAKIMKKTQKCVRHNKFEHNHPNAEKKYDETKVLNIIKEKCSKLTDLLRGSQFLTVRDVFNTVLLE